MDKFFASLVEKVATTFLQVFIAAWLASGALGFDGASKWVLGGVAACLTVIANAVPSPSGLPFWPDLTLRTLRTYVVGFLTLAAGAITTGLTSADPIGFDTAAAIASSAAWGALPAALAVAKGLLARAVPLGTGSPAVLPTRLDSAPVGSFTDAAPYDLAA